VQTKDDVGDPTILGLLETGRPPVIGGTQTHNT